MADIKTVSELWKIMKERIDVIERMGYNNFITKTKIQNIHLYYAWNVIPKMGLTPKQIKQIKNKVSKVLDKY